MLEHVGVTKIRTCQSVHMYVEVSLRQISLAGV
jgi:hypothetical protein